MNDSKELIVVSDAGNGGCNTVMNKGEGKYKAFYVPSVRAIAYGDSLGLGSQFEVQYGYADWYGHRYVVGDDVLNISRRGIERHMGANRYGDELHQFLVAYSLAKLGIREANIKLTLFAPPGIFKEAKKRIIDGFMDGEGKVEIKLSNDRKPRMFTYTDVQVIPEGIGAAACMAFDELGQGAEDASALAGDNLIADLGVYTTDTLLLQNGNFNPEYLQHATWESKGVDTMIRQPILHRLRNDSPDFSGLVAEDIDLCIRTGLKSGKYTISRGGVSADIKPSVEKHRQRLAEWVANTVIDGQFNGLRGIKSMFLVGGGAILVNNFMRDYYGDKVVDLKKNPLTKKVHPVYMNAIGGLRLALWRENKLKG